MKTLFKEPKTASQAAFVIRVSERGQRLLTEGYRIQQYGRSPWYAIFKPENTDTRNAWANYRVDLTPGKEHCTCEAFKAGDCKHRIAAALYREEQARWEAFCADYEAEAALYRACLIDALNPVLSTAFAL